MEEEKIRVSVELTRAELLACVDLVEWADDHDSYPDSSTATDFLESNFGLIEALACAAKQAVGLP